MSSRESRPGEDVAEACADALLTACAQALVLAHRQPTVTDAREHAVAMLDRIIERTQREGARPR